jgi:hypothetical protein
VTVTAKSEISEVNEPLERFVLWALAALHIEVDRKPDSKFHAVLPEQWQSTFERNELAFRLGEGDSAREEESLTIDSPLFHQIVSCLLADTPVLHAVPRNQPESVHQISTALFESYTVDGGHVRLGGCTLEDRPILRVTLRQSANRLIHLFTDTMGHPITESLQEDLELGDLSVISRPPIRVSGQELDKWQEVGLELAPEHNSADAPLLTTVIWCKYATGTLLFSIGRQTAEVSFDGWASRFASKQEKPPPYACPLCDQSSYHLAMTDDKQITVAGGIVPCSESGRRVLRSALETCVASGRVALPEHMRDCPVSRDRVAASALVQCEMCHEQVSPTTIRRGRCTACRELESVTKHEPRIVRLIGEYPSLDRWRRWKISETATTYITVATSMLRRLLLVANKQTLEIRRIATGTIPFSAWNDCEDAQRDELLGTRS